MKLKKEEIQHIAELARLKLSTEEIEKYTRELGSILSYVKMLDKVNTKDIKITSQVNGLMDVFRKDVVKDWDLNEIEAALSQGEREGGAIKVKRVL